MKEVTVQELKEMIDNNIEHQLIDIREGYEVETSNINGTHIPMGEILTRHKEIRTDIPVIIHCRSGARSAAIINQLESRYGLKNLKNLKGGIMAWSKEIDPSIQVS